MKNLYLLPILLLVLSCHNKNAITMVEEIPEKTEAKPIEADTIIDTNPIIIEFKIDSQNIILQQFETQSDYYKKTDIALSIDTIGFTGKYLQLGQLLQHRKVVATIPIINTGEYPMVIRHCKSSGGLLTDCPKEPIFPNDTSYFDLFIYTRDMLGKSTKTATISTNAEQEYFRIIAKWEYI